MRTLGAHFPNSFPNDQWYIWQRIGLALPSPGSVYRSGQNPTGRQPYCRECVATYNQAWYQEHDGAAYRAGKRRELCGRLIVARTG
jgi:hypothetical protein